jgi:hypothetical protein
VKCPKNAFGPLVENSFKVIMVSANLNTSAKMLLLTLLNAHH